MTKKNNLYDYDSFQKPLSVVQRKGAYKNTDNIWKENKVWYDKGDKVFVMDKNGQSKTYTK